MNIGASVTADAIRVFFQGAGLVHLIQRRLSTGLPAHEAWLNSASELDRMIFDCMQSIPNLKTRDETTLWTNYKEGSAMAEKELLRKYEAVAQFYARRYQKPDFPHEDALQWARMGILRAMKDYDAGKSSFMNYAKLWAKSYVIRARGRESAGITLPRPIHELNAKIQEVNHAATAKDQPSDEEIAAQLDRSVQAILRTKTAVHAAKSLIHLDGPPAKDGENQEGLHGSLADPKTEREFPLEISRADLVARFRARLAAAYKAMGGPEAKRDLEIFFRVYPIGEDSKGESKQELADEYHVSRRGMQKIFADILDLIRDDSKLKEMAEGLTE